VGLSRQNDAGGRSLHRNDDGVPAESQHQPLALGVQVQDDARLILQISIGDEDLVQLEAIARSRTVPASWVERSRILLAYRADPSTYAVGEALGVTHQTVKRCLDRAVRLGVIAALDA